MTLDAAQDAPVKRGPVSRGLRALALAALVIGLVLAGQLLPIAAWITRLEGWIGGLGVLGPIVFVLIFVALAMFSLPIWPLAIAAGTFFGWLEGSIVVAIASNAASALGFLAGRHVAYDRIHAFAQRHPRFRDLEEVVAEHEWKVVALMRLSHGFPFGLSNYLCGAMSLRFWPFWLASAAAMLPGMLLTVYAGAAGKASLGDGPEGWLPLAIGIGAMVALIAYVVTLVRKKLKTAVEEGREAK